MNSFGNTVVWPKVCIGCGTEVEGYFPIKFTKNLTWSENVPFGGTRMMKISVPIEAHTCANCSRELERLRENGLKRRKRNSYRCVFAAMALSTIIVLTGMSGVIMFMDPIVTGILFVSVAGGICFCSMISLGQVEYGSKLEPLLIIGGSDTGPKFIFRSVEFLEIFKRTNPNLECEWRPDAY